MDLIPKPNGTYLLEDGSRALPAAASGATVKAPDGNAVISIANRLKELRKKRGLTQKQTAAALKLTETGYQNYEAGRSTPLPIVLKSLASFFNVSPEYLKGESDDSRSEIPDSPETEFVRKVLEMVGGDSFLNDGKFIDELLYLINHDIDYLKRQYEKPKEKNR